MTILTVTAKGQVTLRKEVLKHLGIGPGEKITVDLLPGGRATLRPAKSKTTIDDIVGCIGTANGPAPSIEEINEAIADGWAGKI
ncbi:MAG: regulator of stationary/sporulation expression [Tardiphaga sp.]|jgi:antitoxin PrlF|nr:regulator of stationary/sporulation expression [Tardiphaga sp.]